MITEIVNEKFDKILTEKDFEGNNISEVLAYHLSNDTTKKNKKNNEKNKNIVILIEKLSLDPFFNQIINNNKKENNKENNKENKKNITIIENTSYHKNIFKTQRNKISPFSLLDYGFDIYMPLDSKNFKEIIKKNSNKNNYIIVDEENLPEELDKKDTNGIGPITIDFDNNKEDEDTIMIFSLGISYIPVGQALNQITSKDLQLTICNSISEIKERILKSENRETYKKIIISLDHFNTSLLEKEILTFLYKNNLSDKQLKIVAPIYENQETFLEEYSAEEGKFDADSIAKEILSFIAMPT